MTAKGVAAIGVGVVAVVAVVIGLSTGQDVVVGAGFAVLLAVLAVVSFSLRRGRAEQDVATDDAVAGSRATGGSRPPGTGDWRSGPDEGEYVGRVAGEPDSAAGTTGAQARAERDRRRR